METSKSISSWNGQELPIGDQPKDYPVRRKPDEEPALLGSEPDLFYVEPGFIRDEETFLYIHNYQELVEEPKKAVDGLL